MNNSYDVVVLGAGAAGLMAAFTAGRRGRRVLLLEHADRVGKKILISGGGRCNFTNVNARAENYLSANPHFAKSALAGYAPSEFIAMVQRHGIRYHEKTLGQLFCDDSARQIVTMLEQECAEAGVETRCGVSIQRVARVGNGFAVETSVAGFVGASVVVATGGLSIPKMGATGFGYEVARSFGHSIVEARPGLVPVVFGGAERERWCDLAGLSTEVVASAAMQGKPSRRSRPVAFREKLLVTHRGLSGPAVLQASSYWQPGGELSFDLAPGAEVLLPLQASPAGRGWDAAYNALRRVLPARLAERWVALRAAAGPGDWTNAGLARLEHELHHWQLQPEGTEGFAKAEVTVGGVETRELDARTLQSLRVPGLYFIGEVVDVTGWLGGYNFQWAWASGHAAGQAA